MMIGDQLQLLLQRAGKDVASRQPTTTTSLEGAVRRILPLMTTTSLVVGAQRLLPTQLEGAYQEAAELAYRPHLPSFQKHLCTWCSLLRSKSSLDLTLQEELCSAISSVRRAFLFRLAFPFRLAYPQRELLSFARRSVCFVAAYHLL